MPHHTALVIGQATALRDALVALLSGLPGITEVLEAPTAGAASQLLAQGRVALVLVDATSFEPELTEDLLEMVFATCHPARCAVLTDDSPERARGITADAVLRLGMPAADLREHIGGLLFDESVLCPPC
jgi:hypothetical protein